MNKYKVGIDPQRVTQLLQEMVRIESINPELVPGGSGEKKVAEFAANYMCDAGLEAYVQNTGENHYNAVGILRGTGGGQTLLLDAHLDTVSVEGMADPFSGRVEGNRLYGRGSADDKGGVAAAIEAIVALKKSGIRLSGDLIAAGVSGEEYASEGTEAFIRTYKDVASGCIIGEPSRMSQELYLGIGVGSGGYVWEEYITRGKRAHGSLYEVGIDAIDHMGVVINQLHLRNQKLLAREPYVNPHANVIAKWQPSLHNSTISGGHDLATYPDYCKLAVERRMVYGETFEQVRQEVQELIEITRKERSTMQLEANILFERNPWQAHTGPLLDFVKQETQSILGRAPSLYSVGGWDDGAISSANGIPTVVFGPSGNDWHGPNEYVDLTSLCQCAQVMVNVCIQFCGTADKEG